MPFYTQQNQNPNYSRIVRIYNKNFYPILSEIVSENLCFLRLINENSKYQEYEILTIGISDKYVDDAYFEFLKWVKYESNKHF